MAEVDLPRRLDREHSGASFLYLEIDEEDGSLRRASTEDPAECAGKALGGLFIQEGAEMDSEEARVFQQALPAAFFERYGQLPDGVLLRLSLIGCGLVKRLDIDIQYDDSTWSAKRFQSATKACAAAFKALRNVSPFTCHLGLPSAPDNLIVPKGYTVRAGKLVRKDDRMSIQEIKSTRERLTHYLLSSFSYSNNWFSVSKDAGRPVEETKALIDAVRKAMPDRLCDLYRVQMYASDIKNLSRPNADKVLKKKEHKEARKDLLEVLRYLRKKVPVSKRAAAAAVAEDEDEG